MRNIIKSQGPDSCGASETYCFPDIFKGAPEDASDPNATASSFQRGYADIAPDPPGASPNGSFRKAGLDERRRMQEMALESQQKEAKAYQQGIQDGHKAGFTDGLKEIEKVLHALRQSMQEIKKLRKEICLKAEKETVSLSLAIARKILVLEPETNPRIIAGIVKKTFETVAINAPVRIRINPSELTYMRERRHLIPIEGEVTFVEDASISRGGCMVESLSGDIDARIESQFETVAEAFLPALEKNSRELAESA